MNAKQGNQGLQIWGKILFWGWNLIFLVFMLLGFAPRLFPELITAVRMQTIAPQFLVYALILSLIPLAAMLVGYFRLRHDAYRLFALGYVVEGPLMLLLAVRFFLVRQGSPGLGYLMGIAGMGLAAFLWRLLDQRLEQRGDWAVRLQYIGLTVMLLVALYASLWIVFYALPGTSLLLDLITNALQNIDELFRNPLWLPFSLSGFVLLVFTSTLFILAPIAVPVLAFRAWQQAYQHLAARRQAVPAALAAATVTIAAVVLFAIANRQPQIQAFARLERPPESPEAARRLLENSDELRQGLLNAYLAPFRYISSVGEVTHIGDLYQHAFGVSYGSAQRVQQLYEFVAQPLLYQPVRSRASIGEPAELQPFAMQREPQQAARLYQRVFDETIVEGEREIILAAARSTWETGRAEAALQVLDEREVYIEQQELTIAEHGDWAEIELHEVYRNTTSERQEVIYYFSLPETAVITGVWLGDSPDREGRYSYIVAPRGAAQAVYRNEVRRNLDPALVEQIGPRQYKLRIFPIEPVAMHYDDLRGRWEAGTAPDLHLWLTWKTLANEAGWPMPQLALKRNVFWDEHTLRSLNGAPLPAPSDPEGEPAWLPPALKPQASTAAATHRFDLPGGYTVIAEPVTPATLPALPEGSRLALVIDRSHSMERHAAAVTQAIEDLRLLPAAQIDAYLTAAKFRGEAPQRIPLSDLNAQHLQYLGGQNPAELLAQFSDLSAGQTYDAVLVLTDASGYELGESSVTIPVPDAPVWFVHLDGAIPLGYDDATTSALQGSRGGVAGSVTEAIERIAAALQIDPEAAEDTPTLRDLVDDYVWTTLPTELVPAGDFPAEEPGFAALAARRAILAEMYKNAGQLAEIATLDQLHLWAQNYSIVTPYSSMIVLVTREQEQLLNRLSEADDRFEREVEGLGETQPATQTPLVGVPEPEEWLLILVALALLGYTIYSRGAAGPRAA